MESLGIQGAGKTRLDMVLFRFPAGPGLKTATGIGTALTHK